MKKIQESALKRETWAMKVIDSWGTIPSSGILYGHLFEMGNYDECMYLSVKLHTYEELGIVKGQYCKARIPYENLKELHEFKSRVIDGLPKFLAFPMKPDLSFGICVPNSCSPNLINLSFKNFVSDFLGVDIKNSTNLVVAEDCRKNERISLRNIDYFAIGILGLFIFLMVLCTMFDFQLDSIKKNHFYSALTAFSIKKNGEELFRIQNHSAISNEYTIECLNAMRVLTIIWIVFGHEYTFSYGLNYVNRMDIVKWTQTSYSMIIQFGGIAVDTFFVISGCLVSLGAFKEMEQRKGKLNFPLMYLRRYIRLTPILAILVLLTVSLYRYMGDGPHWNPDRTIDLCEKNWWSTLLYIHNYAHPGQLCLAHSWYLAVDTQLFWLSPIVLFALWKFNKIAIIPMVGIIIASISYVFYETMNRDFNLMMLEMNENDLPKEQLIYYTTHARVSPWLIGVILGYTVFKCRNKHIQISRLITTACWSLTFIMIAALVFGPYHRAKLQPNSMTTKIEVALYESLSRTCWALAVSWIIFACHKGYGGIINKILTLGIFQPMGRLVYNIYLNHVLVQMILIGSTKSDPHFSNLDIITKFWGSFALTVMVSIFTVLAFELPFVEMERIIFEKLVEKRKT